MLDTINIRSENKSNKKTYLSWLWFFIKPYKKLFAFLTINRLIRSGLVVITPFLIKYLIDYVNGDDFKIDPYFVLWILGTYLIIQLIYFAQLYFTYRIESKLSNKIAGEITLFSINHILSLPTKWHESRGSGTKLARIFEGRSSFLEIASMYYWTFLSSFGLITAILFSLIFSTSFQYFILLAIFTLLFFYVARLTNSKLFKANNAVNIYKENNLGKVYDLTSSFSTVKNLNIKKSILRQAGIVENKLLKKIDERAHIQNIRILISDNIVGVIMFILISLYAFYDLINGNITSGIFILIILLTLDFWQALEDISDNYASYLENKNGFIRLTKDLDEKKERMDKNPIVKFNKLWGTININNLSFSYNTDKNILKNISLSIKKGEKIAFVGQSGCGKSTLIKLLLKQYGVGKGEILFEKADIRNIKKTTLLDNISVVSQDSELFNISIKDNILIKAKHPERLSEYIKKANCTFINELKNKEYSIVGERGLMLSGGEKQRISIARALACETDIIILDEATSALDSISESKIQKVIENGFKDKTLIIIAHRLSTIKNVDKIYVMEKGKIIEKGKFNYLIKKDGLFKKLWDKQSIKNENYEYKKGQ